MQGGGAAQPTIQLLFIEANNENEIKNRGQDGKEGSRYRALAVGSGKETFVAARISAYGLL